MIIRIVLSDVLSAREAEEARQKETHECEAQEQLEWEVEEFLAGNRDQVTVEHVCWVEEVQEEYLARKRAVRTQAEKEVATKTAKEAIWVEEVEANTPLPSVMVPEDSVTPCARSVEVVIVAEASTRAGKRKATDAGDGVSLHDYRVLS